MNLWLDAQLSPLIAKWINDQGLRVSATPLRDIGLLKASDREIFQKARMSGAIIVTKDRDFLLLLKDEGPPPQALELLREGEPWVEIRMKLKNRSLYAE
ncbi:DUF5615 family PIN-like protein [Synechococcus sp. UW140]|uniref:DUF5615 family PIN-like protein n=1 Tax=Synechococcus sp. UW140 TaxID=368503 RepID=UPI003137DD59